jgi:hypothetical protein
MPPRDAAQASSALPESASIVPKTRVARGTRVVLRTREDPPTPGGRLTPEDRWIRGDQRTTEGRQIIVVPAARRLRRADNPDGDTV